jgi:hypothetical protein
MAYLDQANAEGRRHPFREWLYGLQEGRWSLPEWLPRALLEGLCAPSGSIRWRCRTCRLGLCDARTYSWCPGCGGTNLEDLHQAGRPSWRKGYP